ncbi:MAG TPA: NAD-dependent epimerase/dehydratase family protein [Candidatus Saccharimonadales bacterium]|nr:NAD-dependent epimerase/dehydratase family protein [Candidatus Saccharimonadales bacterium]
MVKRALVTGGCGFIGSHIVDELLHRKIETYVLDNLSTGNLMNISKHADNELFHFIQGDISEISQIFKSRGGSFEIVFHQAAIASVTLSVLNPSLVFDSNVASTINLLNFCKDSGVRRIVFASSSAVYGDLQGEELSEDNYCKPTSPYGASKIAIEHFLHSFWKTYGLETVSLRYFNVYGPRQSKNEYSGVITIFVDKLMRNEPLVIYGDGKQTRDFVSIRDVVTANMLAMESHKAVGETINIGTGIQTSILDLAHTLKRVTDQENVPIVFSEERLGDIRKSVATTSTANELLGFVPHTTLVSGLKEFVNWQKVIA